MMTVVEKLSCGCFTDETMVGTLVRHFCATHGSQFGATQVEVYGGAKL